MGSGQGSHWLWGAYPSNSELTGAQPLRDTWRVRHPSQSSLPPTHVCMALTVSFMALINGEVQPVKPIMTSKVSSAVECTLGTGYSLTYHRDLSEFLLGDLNWFYRALGI